MGKRKRKMLLFSIVFIGFILLSLIVLTFQFSDYRTKEFTEILDIKEKEITKIIISSPLQTGQQKITTKQDDFNMLIDYLNQFKYKRLIGDKTARMPMRASIIYIYQGEDVYFIVPYGQEAMIHYEVYQIKNGPIEDHFIIDFYHSIVGSK